MASRDQVAQMQRRVPPAVNHCVDLTALTLCASPHVRACDPHLFAVVLVCCQALYLVAQG